MKTSELTGTALDWAVATCEGYTDYDPDTETMMPPRKGYGRVNFDEYSFSTDWSQGGPIIEREGISILYRVGVNMSANINGQYEQSVPYNQRGNAQLIVAMRCYVASKLGDDIELPKELT